MTTPGNDFKRHPQRTLRFSKDMVALSLVCIGGGAILILGLHRVGMIAGVITCALGFGIFFSAGYYWACEN
jgi:hypothetical protein